MGIISKVKRAVGLSKPRRRRRRTPGRKKNGQFKKKK
jgi:hypothetical protein